MTLFFIMPLFASPFTPPLGTWLIASCFGLFCLFVAIVGFLEPVVALIQAVDRPWRVALQAGGRGRIVIYANAQLLVGADRRFDLRLVETFAA